MLELVASQTWSSNGLAPPAADGSKGPGSVDRCSTEHEPAVYKAVGVWYRSHKEKTGFDSQIFFIRIILFSDYFIKFKGLKMKWNEMNEILSVP